MPELPEVETIRAALEPLIVGRAVVEAWSHESDKFTPAVAATGHRFTGAARRGKYLLLALEPGRELVIHLGMTGALRVVERASDDAYVRARWFLDRGVLEFRDVRRFGRIRVVDAGDYGTITTLHHLGPEPFDPAFTPESLWQAIRSSRRRLKAQLLGQRVVAGLGNIYADEALWRAKIYPAQRSLSRAQADRLHPAIVDVLRAGIDNGGTTLRDYRTVSGAEGENQFFLDCYGRAGEPCPRCAQRLQARVWDGRTTTFCPRCQPR